MVGYIKYEDELRLSNAWGGYEASLGTCGYPSGKDGACKGPPLVDVVYGDFTSKILVCGRFFRKSNLSHQ